MITTYIVIAVASVWFTIFLLLLWRLIKVFDVLANVTIDKHHQEVLKDYAERSVFLAEGYDKNKLGSPNKTEDEKPEKLVVATQVLYDSMEQSGFASPKDGYEHIIQAEVNKQKALGRLK